jgi:hypothetical protein
LYNAAGRRWLRCNFLRFPQSLHSVRCAIYLFSAGITTSCKSQTRQPENLPFSAQM